MTKFTVIIPCYNAVATLAETVASLAAQTLTDWEAILVDDGSSDATPELIGAICANDARFRSLRFRNGGPSAARNRAADVARGRYLAFLDADDIWVANKLAQTLAAFESAARPAAVFGQIGFFRDAEGPDFTTSTVVGGATPLKAVMGENPVCTLSNLSVDAAVFAKMGGFDEDFRYSEDLEFLLRLVGSGSTLWGLNALHVRYRASEEGLSANLTRMHDGWRRALLAAQTSGAPISQTDFRQAEAIHLRYLARRALRMGAGSGVAVKLALGGMWKSPYAFLSDPYRGAATLVGCLSAPFLPGALRARLFA